MISRRHLLSRSFTGAAAAGGLLLAGRSVLAAKATAQVESIATISKNPEYYNGWPTIAQDARGSLYVVVSGGRESHVCPFGRVELLRSHDEGKTWTWPEVLMDSAIDDRDAGICVTTAGTLLVTTFTSLAYENNLANAKNWPAERLARWNEANSRISGEERKKLLGTWMLRSTDGGLTWSSPYRVPVNSPHGAIPLADGRVFYAGKALWTSEERVGVSISEDDGKTWGKLSDLPIQRGDSSSGYHELHAVETSSGRLIVQIRNHNNAQKGETLQCESSDGGKSWTEPHAIGVWGLPSHLLRTKSGRLLMSYGYRREPFGNQVRISDDEGANWSEPVTISDDGIGVDLGYPSTVELSDGAFLTVWYERKSDSPRAVLRAARWRWVA